MDKSGGISPESTKKPAHRTTGQYHILALGIKNYDHRTVVNCALKDTNVLCDLLEFQYGFQVNRLDEDAIPDDLYDALETYTCDSGHKNSLKEHDALLIWMSGHGDCDPKGSGRSYFIPKEGSKKLSIGTSINYVTTRDFFKNIAARQIIIVSDSCFAAGAYKGEDSADNSAHPNSPENKELDEVVRQALTSGRMEPVSDEPTMGHSPFAYAMIDALQKNKNKLFTAEQLIAEIKGFFKSKTQYPQKPNLRHLVDCHDYGGHFVFTRLDKAKGKFIGLKKIMPTTKIKKKVVYLRSKYFIAAMLALFITYFFAIFIKNNIKKMDSQTIGKGLTIQDWEVISDKRENTKDRIVALERLSQIQHNIDGVDFSCEYYGGQIIDRKIEGAYCSNPVNLFEFEFGIAAKKPPPSQPGATVQLGTQEEVMTLLSRMGHEKEKKSVNNMSNCDFSGTILLSMRAQSYSFMDCNFSYSNLYDANLSKLIARDSDFSFVNFENVMFTDAVLIRVNLSNANLDGANLTGTKFTNVAFTNATFSTSNISSSDFSDSENVGLTQYQIDQSWAWADSPPVLSANFLPPKLCPIALRRDRKFTFDYESRPKQC